MEPYAKRNSLASSLLIQAFANATLGHSRYNCAVSVLLGGTDWMEAIEPRTGTIDHRNKTSHPRRFAKGLRQIESASFSVDEIIALEACFEGRSRHLASEGSIRVSTLDDSNDPDGAIGLNAVLQYLHQQSIESPATRVLATVS